jgi:pimeloyl-ACP methyl ester carboxylesterase
MRWEPFTAVTDAGPIAGSAAAGEPGPPLLLLHGGPALSDYMGMLEPELDGWRPIRYQQRGLPPSSASGPFSVRQHVADAVAVLDELSTGPAFVLGHSWGGYLALQLALDRPDLVTGLVLADPLGGIGDGGFAALGQALIDRMTPASAAGFAAVSARLAGPDATHADQLAALALMWPSYFAQPATAPPLPAGMDLSEQCYAETIGDVIAQLSDGFGGRLQTITTPAVFVLGEQSPLPPALAGQPTAAAMPRAEVRLIPAAGHLPWYEQPGCVAAALDQVRTLAS